MGKKAIIWSVVVGACVVVGTVLTIFEKEMIEEPFEKISQCFFSSEISEKNKALIDETITTVAESGLFSLMGKKSHLEQMGAVLSKEVPDLTYWAYVLSTPKLAQDMKIIQGSSMKYNGFVKGTRDRLMREHRQNPCLLEQAKGFAKYLKIPEEKTVEVLKKSIESDGQDKKAFKAFLDYIIDAKVK